MLPKTIIAVGIGLIGLPTVALGGSFVSSLIAGKTPSEAVTILTEQIDSLLGRVDAVEKAQEAITETIATVQASTTAETDALRQKVELLEAQNKALEKQGKLLKEQTAALDEENTRVKAGLQEAYDYVGAVDDTVITLQEETKKLDDELHPPKIKRIGLLSSEVRRDSNGVQLIVQVKNTGNVDITVRGFEFTIGGFQDGLGGRIDTNGSAFYAGEKLPKKGQASLYSIVPVNGTRVLEVWLKLVDKYPATEDLEAMVAEAAKTTISIDAIYTDGEVAIQFPIK